MEGARTTATIPPRWRSTPSRAQAEPGNSEAADPVVLEALEDGVKDLSELRLFHCVDKGEEVGGAGGDDEHLLLWSGAMTSGR